MTVLKLPAPAKLNLFLHITGRRDDGYHNLQTLFQILDYGDELEFSLRNDDVITLQPQVEGVPEESNLVCRAAMSLREASGVIKGCDIRLQKRLPMGGGLGGGSSDAATALVGLNRLWDCGLGTGQLAELGRKLGADVPLFVRGDSAFAEGVGEQLTPVELPPCWYLVITPDCHVSTAEIFSNPALTRNTSTITIRALSTGLDSGLFKNDCQTVVEQLYPPVHEALEWLRQYATALMTGTGASVFASFASRAEAQAVLAEVPQNWQAFVATGVNRSTLYQRLP